MSAPRQLTRRETMRAGGGLLGGFGLFDLFRSAPRTVRANVGYDSSAARAAIERAASAVVWEFGFEAVTVELPADALDRLGDRTDVRYAERDRELEIIQATDGGETLPWGVDRVDAEVAHEHGTTGDGAQVAIIDTGIDLRHGDLAANIGPGMVVQGGVAVGPMDDIGQDDNGHGTHCAGIVAAAGNDRGVVGVTPDATVHPVKAISATGAGLTSDVAFALERVAEEGWDVANLSLGGGDSELMREACQDAADRGVVVVAAAGNDGGEEASYPARYETVIAVGATTSDDEVAAFSAGGRDVDILAPGVDVYSTFLGGYATLDGTSMAAPHVAGAAAIAGDDSIATDGTGILDVAATVGLDSGDDRSGENDPGVGGSGVRIDAVDL